MNILEQISNIEESHGVSVQREIMNLSGSALESLENYSGEELVQWVLDTAALLEAEVSKDMLFIHSLKRAGILTQLQVATCYKLTKNRTSLSMFKRKAQKYLNLHMNALDFAIERM